MRDPQTRPKDAEAAPRGADLDEPDCPCDTGDEESHLDKLDETARQVGAARKQVFAAMADRRPDGDQKPPGEAPKNGSARSNS